LSGDPYAEAAYCALVEPSTSTNARSPSRRKVDRLEGQANQLANLGFCYEEQRDVQRALDRLEPGSR
jgi:hypothetical protein